MTPWRKTAPWPPAGHPWRTASPPSPPPQQLDPRARVALCTSAAGWALVLVGALAPGLAGAEGAGGVAGLVALTAWAAPGGRREP